MVDGDEFKALMQEMAQNQSAITAVNEGSGLGYRGLVVDALSDNVSDKYDLPSSFRMPQREFERIGDRRKSGSLDAPGEGAGRWPARVLLREIQQLGSREETSEPDRRCGRRRARRPPM